MKKSSSLKGEITQKLLSFYSDSSKTKAASCIRIGNLVIFPKERKFLLSRKGKMIVFYLTKEGRIVININGYDGYLYDPFKMQVFSSKSKKVLQPIKNTAVKSYELSKNGIKEIVPEFKILLNHWPEIEASFIAKLQ